MAHSEYRLNYGGREELEAAIDLDSLKHGDRVIVKIGDGSDYVFTFYDLIDGRIKGRSALNGGEVDLDIYSLQMIVRDPVQRD